MYSTVGSLKVNPALLQTVDQILPGTGLSRPEFWAHVETLLQEFSPRNASLLKERDAIQAQIDAYVLMQVGKPWDPSAYAAFLASIGYLLPQPKDFQVETSNVDAEISSTPGPQLVVPVDNAR